MSKVDPDSTGLNPAWRKALVHVGFGGSWDESAPTAEITRIREQLAQRLKKISDVTPGSGAYLNEVTIPVFRPYTGWYSRTLQGVYV